MNKPILRPAVFLDRDGTINIEKDYLIDPEAFEFIAGVPEAIACLNRAGFLVVVVTNQSGVARGYFDLDQVQALHIHMQQQLMRYDAMIDAVYVCPHHPQGSVDKFRIDCNCRKGKPGMLLHAGTDLGIDLSHSYMIGDKQADVEAGLAAGCRTFLVRTGYGVSAIPFATAKRIPVVDDLSAAVRMILESDC